MTKDQKRALARAIQLVLCDRLRLMSTAAEDEYARLAQDMWLLSQGGARLACDVPAIQLDMQIDTMVRSVEMALGDAVRHPPMKLKPDQIRLAKAILANFEKGEKGAEPTE